MKNKFLLGLCLIAIVFCEKLTAQTCTSYAANTTWTIPAGVTTMTVYVFGAGGGSGGGVAASNDNASGGGGGGACAINVLTVSAGQIYTLTVGAGGTAGTTAGTNGGTGGSSTITGTGGTVTANGGGGGGGVTINGGAGTAGAGATTGAGYSTIYAGGNGTVGVRSTLQEVGGAGGGGAGSGGAGANGTAGNTSGGSSTGGAGGSGTYPGGAGAGATNTGSSLPGVAGNAPGGGAAGEANYTTAEPGAIGGAGQIVICYCINCSGTPTGGTAAASVTSGGCSTYTTALSLSGNTNSCGITYQWQSSPDNSTWTNMAGATAATYTPTVSSTTYYRCVLTCSNGGATGASSSVLCSSTIPVNDACSGAVALTSGVAVAATNTCATNNTGGVSDPSPSCKSINFSNTLWYTYTTGASIGDLTISVTRGTITYAAVSIYSGTCGSFTQIGCNDPNTSSANPSATVTCLAANTTYYIMIWDDAGSVGTFTLTPTFTPTGCSGTPTGGSASATVVSGCSSYASTISLSGNSTGCGITYQWQSSTDNSTWSNIAGATSSTYAATVSSSTYYQCVISCSASGLTGASSSVFCSEGGSSNDACASATAMGAFTTINNAQANTVTYSVSITGYNTCATADQTSPACNTANQNIWYTFTAPVAGNYYVGVDAGTISYPDVAVWSGACGSLTLLGCAGVSSANCVVGTSNGTAQPYGFNNQIYSYAGACNLTAGQVVRVSVDNWCGWNPGTFTLSVVSISNDGIPAAGIIASCGTSFNSSTIGATNCNNCAGTGSYNDLDCNSGTVASGNSSGADVYSGMSVENDSWYQFCTTTAQTYSLTLTPTSSTCKGPDANTATELQMNLYTGTPSALTWVNGNTAGTSPLTYTISLAANGCAYVEVDGFAGTNCDYSILLQASPGCPLPLNLLSFTGENLDNHKIKLKWVLASEKDVDSYVIEKSSNGNDYSSVAKIKSAGNTTQQGTYYATDDRPLNGYNYYRLSAIDMNGVQNIAAHTMVTNKTHLPGFNVYPNPARDKINVSLVNFSSAVTIEIYDMYGKQVFSSVAIPENGNMLQEIDLSSFAKGVYFVKAFDGENIFKQSIIVNNDR